MHGVVLFSCLLVFSPQHFPSNLEIKNPEGCILIRSCFKPLDLTQTQSISLKNAVELKWRRDLFYGLVVLRCLCRSSKNVHVEAERRPLFSKRSRLLLLSNVSLRGPSEFVTYIFQCYPSTSCSPPARTGRRPRSTARWRWRRSPLSRFAKPIKQKNKW